MVRIVDGHNLDRARADHRRVHFKDRADNCGARIKICRLIRRFRDEVQIVPVDHASLIGLFHHFYSVVVSNVLLYLF